MSMTFASSLTILKKGWAVTAISIASIFVTSALMLVFVPLGRRLLPEGGECAGAAMSVICSEACVLVAMITRYRRFPLDARNVHVFAKIAALAVLTLVLNHRLRFLGGVRLVFDGAFYLGLAFAIGVVRVRDIAHVIRLLRHREGEGAPSQTGQAEAGSGYA
jgi:hypothetical protein